ncbi:hypothetical protein [Empedobacter sp.]|uniref:hypothetical protein n=1 Tax=Empedobacter sp. TaxID=1927715 RepID=UPI002898CA97|nr:hypothetical protein [Empedobacter sp.]
MNKNELNTAVDQQKFFQELNEKLQAETREKLTATPFPFDEIVDPLIDSNVLKIGKVMLQNISLNRLKIDVDVFEDLANENYNLFSIPFLLNGLQDFTPNELGITPIEYVNLIRDAYVLGELHSKHANPIKDEIQKKFQKKADEFQNQQLVEQNKMQKQDNKKVIPMNRK